MKIDFEKFSGAKNIFLIREKLNLSTDQLGSLTKKICDPYEGFFADGAVFLESLAPGEFKWHFFNSDGSGAEMCGNATRCAHAFVLKKISSAMTKISIQTGAGTITSESKNDFFHVQMSEPRQKLNLELTTAFFKSANDFEDFKKVASTSAYFVDTGVPHLVIVVNDWESALKLKSLWMFLRQHKFFVKGTNVTLIQPGKQAPTKAISFERGVDDFTQACGTGATAAALYVCDKLAQKNVTVVMPGGQLQVDFNGKTPTLIGSADYIGQVTTEFKE
ncbi:MAG: diaminopimelate epimerase [Bdellovibrionaceae bacterium]|nr:diaminopimelate epimerase [Pseudobdellovibrionaceae bacterium]